MSQREWTLVIAAPLVALVGFALSILAPYTPTARADISGPCDASINREPVDGRGTGPTDSPIKVSKNSNIPVSMSADEEISRLSIKIELLGQTVKTINQNTSGDSWEEIVDVDDYAEQVGVYKVIGESYDDRGGLICSGEALVEVDGNPLSTVAGVAAAGATGVGALAMVATTAVAANSGSGVSASINKADVNLAGELAGLGPEDQGDRLRGKIVDEIGKSDDYEDFIESIASRFLGCTPFLLPAVLLTLGAVVAGGGGLPAQPAPGPQPLLPRGSKGLRLSLIGIMGGLIAGAGVVVLLQQYAIVYPTLVVGVVGLAVGLVLGIVLPTLGRSVAVDRYNRAVARAERRVFQLEHPSGPSAGQ